MTKPELQRKISNILKHGNINKPENSGAKQGLEKALEILKSNQKDLSGINELDLQSWEVVEVSKEEAQEMINHLQKLIKQMD